MAGLIRLVSFRLRHLILSIQVMKKALTVSIVIPVYNEELHLEACLDALAAQTMQPLDVLVVDNNSTDASVSIAKRYPFVKVITETRQGQVFAQARGFSVANGNILGRIDGDTILDGDWVERVSQIFGSDSDIVALTGTANPYDISVPFVGRVVFNFYHQFIARLLAGHPMLWGANCAVRGDSWERVQQNLHYDTNIWEDFDLSFHLETLGRLVYVKDLRANCSFRVSHTSIARQAVYQFRSYRTFRLHRNRFISILYFIIWYSMTPFIILTFVDRLVLKLRGQPVHTA